uniref:Transcription initiation factor IIF subunit alpha n=1 Tax=Macrostomum lignano TaxID=282301 RepID=A0A1I8FB57_9PLAT
MSGKPALGPAAMAAAGLPGNAVGRARLYKSRGSPLRACPASTAKSTGCQAASIRSAWAFFRQLTRATELNSRQQQPGRGGGGARRTRGSSACGVGRSLCWRLRSVDICGRGTGKGGGYGAGGRRAGGAGRRRRQPTCELTGGKQQQQRTRIVSFQARARLPAGAGAAHRGVACCCLRRAPDRRPADPHDPRFGRRTARRTRHWCAIQAVAIMPPGACAAPQLLVCGRSWQQQQQVIRLGSSQQPQFYQLQRATAQQQSQAAVHHLCRTAERAELRSLAGAGFVHARQEASLQRLGQVRAACPPPLQRQPRQPLRPENRQPAAAPDVRRGQRLRQAERDEAKKRKHAGALRRFNPLSFHTGSGRDAAKKFKGSREGITANAAYWVFMKSEANNTFEALPADGLLLSSCLAYRGLPHFNWEEAEEEFNKAGQDAQQVHLMLQRWCTRLNAKDEAEARRSRRGDKDGDDGEDLDRGDGGGGGGRSSRRSRLQLTDMDEFGDEAGDSDEADADDRDGERRPPRSPAAGAPARPLRRQRKEALPAASVGARFKRKRKEGQPGSEDEGGGERDPDGEVEDESELDDHEGDELDYLTHSSSGSVSESEKEKGLDQEDAMKGLLVSDEEESETEGGAAAVRRKEVGGRSKPSKSVGKGADEDDGEDGEDEEDSDRAAAAAAAAPTTPRTEKLPKKEKKQQHKKKKNTRKLSSFPG